MKRIDSKWLWFAGFALVWLALRVFWITCDSGVPSTWEYGFHTTDEGYYLCGGKEMYLWGSFVNLTRGEALNYCYSYGTHWLSYLAHLCFGLSTWTWRIPFSLLYFAGWLLMFGNVAKRIGGGFAFATCCAASSVPLILTYERSASNDTTIAALVAIAFCLAAGKGVWRIFAAALVTSLIGTVKPAVLVMMPIVLSSLLEERKTKSRWIDAGAYAVTTLALMYAWKGLSAFTVLDVARANGLSPWEVLLKVNATYGLPTILDLAQDFRTLASFPRDPSIRIMGPTVVLISVVPAAMLLVNLMRRKWNGHLLLYLMIPLYALALNVINSMYSHYFLPILVLLPALATAICENFADLKGEPVPWKRLAVTLVLGAAILGVAVVFLLSANYAVQEAAPLYSRIHNLPQMNPWRMTWPLLAVGTVVGVAVVTAFRGLKACCRESWIWAISFFLIVSVAAAALPAAVVAPRLRLDPSLFYWPLALNLVVGCLFALVLFVRPSVLARPLGAASLIVVPILAAYLLLPTWRSAAVELVTVRTHHDAELASELGKILPKNAVLFGERSDQVLMSMPIRAVTTYTTWSNPIPFIERIRKEDPSAPLYALIDPDCPYNLNHFKEHAKDYRLETVRKFRMPATGSGRLGDLYLCRIHPLALQKESHETNGNHARRSGKEIARPEYAIMPDMSAKRKRTRQ